MAQVKTTRESNNFFKNKWLERLTRTHIAVPITFFLLLSAVFLVVGFVYTIAHPLVIVGLFFLGLLSFTFAEYVVHRFVFHANFTSKIGQRIQYGLHGLHHEYPKAKDRLAMPMFSSITLAAALFGLFYLLLHTKVFAFLPGFMTGYAGYLFVHYITHIYRRPKNIFKALWTNHSHHHFKDNLEVFGVSSPLWDYVFGTMPKKKKKKAPVQVSAK